MAPTDRKLRWLAALIACCAATVTAAQAPPVKGPTALPGTGDQPINLDAASSEVDYKTNTVEFKDVVISQGDMRIQSDRAHATGLNFANSKWDFEGNVRIDAEQRGNLRSDSRDRRVSRQPHPARHRDRQAGQLRAEAHRFRADGARPCGQDPLRRQRRHRPPHRGCLALRRAERDLRPVLVYNIRAQKVQADTTPDDGQRVHIIIQPRGGTGKDAGKTPDAGKPQPTPQS